MSFYGFLCQWNEEEAFATAWESVPNIPRALLEKGGADIEVDHHLPLGQVFQGESWRRGVLVLVDDMEV